MAAEERRAIRIQRYNNQWFRCDDIGLPHGSGLGIFMYEVTVEDTFAAGHYLRNYKGKCENPARPQLQDPG